MYQMSGIVHLSDMSVCSTTKNVARQKLLHEVVKQEAVFSERDNKNSFDN